MVRALGEIQIEICRLSQDYRMRILERAVNKLRREAVRELLEASEIAL